MIAARREGEKLKQLVRDRLVSTRLLPSLVPRFLHISLRLTTRPLVFSIQMEENMMRHRAILTGTFQRATYYNKPLPRMKVQPLHVSGMINKRHRARERRRVQQWTLASLTKHMEAEARFEKMLRTNAAQFGQGFKSVFHHMDWRKCILPSSDTAFITVVELKLNFHYMFR